MANELAHASSPYLRQHADNPVDWLEWGEDAFRKATDEDKPIFLSVGYASCHWCHVMAHESFEDEEVAQALNAHFVPVKVDREERPDVDAVYMSAVQALTGQGGWPMSVFLTPDGEPFFGGTYWPKDDRGGMAGFMRVLQAVRQAWEERRDDVRASSEQLTAHLRAVNEDHPQPVPLHPDLVSEAAGLCVHAWDTTLGGFGAAPKFPQAMTIDFLLAHHTRTGDDSALEAATHSLEAMSRGGIYDHVGGGFARYSVDPQWLVPHFEKMLYDNALLLRAYTHAAAVQPSGPGHDSLRRRFARVARETAAYLLGEMRHEAGGFFSSTDADSEGVEGKFFTWPADEFRAVVTESGEDPEEWAAFLGVTDGGNFERRNILHEPLARTEDDAAWAQRWQRVRAALYARRAERVPPALDDKLLASWNGLALGALAEAGALLAEPDYVQAAADCARFVRDNLVVDGLLQHSWREGHGASVPAFCEDVAFLAQGLVSLYEADGDPAWLVWARELAADADARFAEVRDGVPTGAYFATSHDAEALIARPKDQWDNATPAAPSVMADVHLRLGALTGETGHHEQADRILAAFAGRARQAPTGYGEMLRAAERRLGGPVEVAVVGPADDPRTEALIGVYRQRWRPGAVLAMGAAASASDAHVPLLAGRGLVDDAPAAYVCRGFVCEQPVTDPDALASQLTDAA